MRFMIIVKASADSEAGIFPVDDTLMAEMTGYHEALQKAGVLLDGNGLKPSAQGWRIHYGRDGQRRVVDGPFAETKELVAGYWLWNVKSMDEAVEWVRRCPNPMESDSEIEIRRVFEAEDFGAELTPDLRAQEERLRAEAQKLKPR
ncbi:MAG: YciI family protein [Caldimonas sp.]